MTELNRTAMVIAAILGTLLGGVIAELVIPAIVAAQLGGA